MKSLLLKHAQQQQQGHQNAAMFLSMLKADTKKIEQEKRLAAFYSKVIYQQEREGNKKMIIRGDQ